MESRITSSRTHTKEQLSVVVFEEMAAKNVIISATAAYAAYCYYKYLSVISSTQIKKPWKKRRWWMKTINRQRTRETQLAELVAEPGGEFENFTRMTLVDFEYLLNKVSSIISKKNTSMREAIPPNIRLAITLRYLATGDSFKSLHFLFKVSSEIISRIVPEVCTALNQVLKDEIKIPSTAEEWVAIEEGFRENFPHAVGAIDGKHVVIKCPDHTGSEYFNYKRTFSIVLLALVDSNYQFIFADIGSQGRISDGGVFRNCALWRDICENRLNLPPPCPLPGSNVTLPYVFLGDGAFALSENLMKPYPGDHGLNSPKRIFNKKLSRSRVLSENTFGILTARFRIFKKPIDLMPEKAKVLTMTCILLHNFLMKSSRSQHVYNPHGTVDRTENGAIRSVQTVARRSPMSAITIRQKFTDYFMDF